MSLSGELVLRYILDSSATTVTVRCIPNTITILADETGAISKGYEEELSKGGGSTKLSFILNGVEVKKDQIFTVGFGEKIQSGSIPNFISSLGHDSKNVERIIEELELSEFLHLPCEFLPLQATRKLLILQAITISAPIVVFNDPFQPFNGRWRENLAERILNSVEEKIIVCLNLSFLPKSWSNNTLCLTCDLPRLTDEAITQAKIKLEAAAQLAAQREIQRERNEKYYNSDINGYVPTPIRSAYKGVRDWILDPLANISRFARSFSGIIVLSGLTFLLITMGVVMFPYLTQQQSLLKTISGKLNWKWGDMAQTEHKELAAIAAVPDMLSGTPLDIDSDKGSTNVGEFEETALPLALQFYQESISLSLGSTYSCSEIENVIP